MDLKVGDEDEDETEKPSGSQNVMNLYVDCSEIKVSFIHPLIHSFIHSIILNEIF